MKTIFTILTLSTMLLTVVSCNKTELRGMKPKTTTGVNETNIQKLATTPGSETTHQQRSTSGNIDGVYYNFYGYNISANRTLSDAKNANLLYVYNVPATPGINYIWVSVTNTTMDGNKSTWTEIFIRFNPEYPVRQFQSSQQVEQAASTGEITLTYSGYVYTGRIR